MEQTSLSSWISVKKRKPTPFDLVEILLDTEKVRKGWWCGTIWDGRVDINDKQVIAWRPIFKAKRNKGTMDG